MTATSCSREAALPDDSVQTTLIQAARDGCASDQVRVRTALVDVCVGLYEEPGFGAAPVALTYDEANELCLSRGRRLCTEQEWETACRGPDGHLYPYGDRFNPTACVVGEATSAAVGSRNVCRSGFGAYDMSGNAGEWVRGPLIKGGDFGADDFGSRCGARARATTAEIELVTARCCGDPS